MLEFFKMIIAGIFGMFWFPMVIFLALLKDHKKASVSSLYIAFVISLGYTVFVMSFCIAVGYSFNGIKYFLSGIEPFSVIKIIALAMLAAPFLPCFKNKKKAVILFFLIAHIGIIMFFPLESLCSWKLRKFDPQKWEEVHYIRNEMVEDIRDSNLLEGMSGDEIKNILGEPSETQDYSDGTAKYIYYSGNGSFITVWMENGEYYGIRFTPPTGIGQH